MKITIKKTKAGLLLQATEKRDGKTVTLKTLPEFLAKEIKRCLRSPEHEAWHRDWLANEVARLRSHYIAHGEISKDDPADMIIESLVWDLFVTDKAAMKRIIYQMNNWYENFTKQDSFERPAVKRPAGGSTR